MPTLNAFPLHPSVLEPHFDLEDEKDIMSYCLQQADTCVSIDVFCGILEKKKNRRKLPGLSAPYPVKVLQADFQRPARVAQCFAWNPSGVHGNPTGTVHPNAI